ncbi:MAG: AAA family ATPase [bacterium]|nr:AAA family ATPase [bacterium]
MNSCFIGITGGSGSGKTALARELKKHFGKRALIFHIDNYQKFGEKLPEIQGMKNWDHPRSIKWERMIKDLLLLEKGKTITIKSRDQKNLKRVEEKTLRPSEIIIVEGYFLFYKSLIRELLDFSIFLEASEKARIKRRTKPKNTKYIQKILLPMHNEYIEPTKRFADLILNTEKLSIKQCVKK